MEGGMGNGEFGRWNAEKISMEQSAEDRGQMTDENGQMSDKNQ